MIGAVGQERHVREDSRERERESQKLAAGYRYMFVSNSDNLGATMDLKILTHFVQSGAPFMMEVAERTDADPETKRLRE